MDEASAELRRCGLYLAKPKSRPSIERVMTARSIDGWPILSRPGLKDPRRPNVDGGQEFDRRNGGENRSDLIDSILLNQAPERPPVLASRESRVSYVAMMGPKQRPDVRSLKLFDSQGLAAFEREIGALGVHRAPDRNVFRFDRLRFTKHKDLLDYILQLPYIAWPGVLAKHVDCFGREMSGRTTSFRLVHVPEMTGQ